MKYLKHEESICSYHTMMHNNNSRKTTSRKSSREGRLYNSIFKTARAMLFDKCLLLGTDNFLQDIYLRIFWRQMESITHIAYKWMTGLNGSLL